MWQDLWNSRVVKIALLFTIIAIFIIVAIRILLPPRPPQQAAILESIGKPIITFIFPYPDYPDQLGIYYSEHKTPTIQSLAEQLAFQFDLKPVQGLQNYWSDEPRKEVLSYTSDDLIVYRTGEQFATSKTANPNVDLDLTRAEALRFLSKTGLFDMSMFTLAEPIPVAFTIHDYEVTSLDNANGIMYNVQHFIENFPLSSGKYSQPPAVIWVTTDGRLVRANFFQQATDLKLLSRQKTMNENQVKDQITTGKATFLVINNVDPFEPPVNAKNLASITLTNASVEYRINPENGFVLPYLLASGGATSNEGILYKVELISPLVELAPN